MKKLGLFAMAFALVLGLSQCKKENNATPANEGVKVPITLNVSGGSRVAVNPETGEVGFNNGDIIYVVSGGHYVGTLTYSNSYYNSVNFFGQITNPIEGEKLQFYFLGNVNPEEALTVGSSTGCSVVISEQTTSTNHPLYPVISYAPSRENYEVGRTDYNATLLNKCALVKFDVTTEAGTSTCIKGMNNKVTVDFSTNTFEYNQEGEGVITLPSGNGEKWAILLPQDEVTNPEVSSLDGTYTGTCGAIPAIAENDYLTEGIAVTLDVLAVTFNNLFTINLDGDKVCFSQGNLQYQASTNTWRFAENQWDFVGTQTPYSGNPGGTVSGSDNNNVSPTYSGWIDLFGWGTSGYDHGAVCYQPWSTSTVNADYYAYGDWQYNLYDQTGQADWGYNPIDNGDNIENSGWRTLTKDEWNYLLKTRSTPSGIRFTRATVNDVCGLILLPDNWDPSVFELVTSSNVNGWGTNYNSNIISATDWANILETNGAVFLPATGSREIRGITNVGSTAIYWSSSINNSDYAYGISFKNTGGVDYVYGSRFNGRPVRLVRDVE